MSGWDDEDEAGQIPEPPRSAPAQSQATSGWGFAVDTNVIPQAPVLAGSGWGEEDEPQQPSMARPRQNHIDRNNDYGDGSSSSWQVAAPQAPPPQAISKPADNEPIGWGFDVQQTSTSVVVPGGGWDDDDMPPAQSNHTQEQHSAPPVQASQAPSNFPSDNRSANDSGGGWGFAVDKAVAVIPSADDGGWDGGWGDEGAGQQNAQQDQSMWNAAPTQGDPSGPQMHNRPEIDNTKPAVFHPRKLQVNSDGSVQLDKSETWKLVVQHLSAAFDAHHQKERDSMNLKSLLALQEKNGDNEISAKQLTTTINVCRERVTASEERLQKQIGMIAEIFTGSTMEAEELALPDKLSERLVKLETFTGLGTEDANVPSTASAAPIDPRLAARNKPKSTLQTNLSELSKMATNTSKIVESLQKAMEDVRTRLVKTEGVVNGHTQGLWSHKESLEKVELYLGGAQSINYANNLNASSGAYTPAQHIGNATPGSVRGAHGGRGGRTNAPRGGRAGGASPFNNGHTTPDWQESQQGPSGDSGAGWSADEIASANVPSATPTSPQQSIAPPPPPPIGQSLQDDSVTLNEGSKGPVVPTGSKKGLKPIDEPATKGYVQGKIAEYDQHSQKVTSRRKAVESGLSKDLAEVMARLELLEKRVGEGSAAEDFLKAPITADGESINGTPDIDDTTSGAVMRKRKRMASPSQNADVSSSSADMAQIRAELAQLQLDVRKLAEEQQSTSVQRHSISQMTDDWQKLGPTISTLADRLLKEPVSR